MPLIKSLSLFFKYISLFFVVVLWWGNHFSYAGDLCCFCKKAWSLFNSSESDNQITREDLDKLFDARQAETISKSYAEFKSEGYYGANIFPTYDCSQDHWVIGFYPLSIEEVDKDPLKKVAVYLVDTICDCNTLNTPIRP